MPGSTDLLTVQVLGVGGTAISNRLVGKRRNVARVPSHSRGVVEKGTKA